MVHKCHMSSPTKHETNKEFLRSPGLKHTAARLCRSSQYMYFTLLMEQRQPQADSVIASRSYLF